ncbi:cysteine dioxygenase family protein [Pontibacillus salicampi]|uniref:Cysteine dioxygenase family protein n=1 Tax=Pontibacillus salicampi TaxID=1449801 RepID=A0ABV6LUV3_9BACI
MKVLGDFSQRVTKVLGGLADIKSDDLKEALLALEATPEDLKPHLETAQGKPYYRTLLYQDEQVELLVMNWSQLECAPHDHGESYGWVQVVDGASLHTVYEVKDNKLPEELFEERQEKGNLFFAPKKGVHKMKDAGGTGLMTLHLYAPPISGMIVYDLNVCAACIVSDDCGAWWPEETRQKVKEIKLERSK